MNNERITLEVSVPKERPDENWREWDEETFYLREHLHKLIEAYGIDVLREELNECEWLLDKKKVNKNKEKLDLVYRHIGHGKFVVEIEEGTLDDLEQNEEDMIMYTYFEGSNDFPPFGWKTTRGNLLEDYQSKAFKDFQDGKLEVSHTDENGIKHYKKKNE